MGAEGLEGEGQRRGVGLSRPAGLGLVSHGLDHAVGGFLKHKAYRNYILK